MSETKVIYTNSVSISSQFYDFNLVFGTNLPDGTTHEEVRVFMSPQHAKALAHALMNNVIKYEEVFGKIDVLDEDKIQSIMAAKGVPVNG